MKTAIIKFKSVSRYQQGRHYDKYVPRLPKESHEAYEERTWRERAHYDSETRKIFIPGMAFKKSLEDISKYDSVKTQGNQTWTKHFLAGILVTDNIELDISIDEVKGEWVDVPARGKGGDTRVWRCFPTIEEWEGKLKFFLLDDKITKDIFEYYMHEAGKFMGIGVWRAQKGGLNGRFSVEKIKWSSE